MASYYQYQYTIHYIYTISYAISFGLDHESQLISPSRIWLLACLGSWGSQQWSYCDIASFCMEAFRTFGPYWSWLPYQRLRVAEVLAGKLLLAPAEHGRLGYCCHYHVQYQHLPSVWGSEGLIGQNWRILPITIRSCSQSPGSSGSSRTTGAWRKRQDPLHWQGSTYSKSTCQISYIFHWVILWYIVQ